MSAALSLRDGDDKLKLCVITILNEVSGAVPGHGTAHSRLEHSTTAQRQFCLRAALSQLFSTFTKHHSQTFIAVNAF